MGEPAVADAVVHQVQHLVAGQQLTKVVLTGAGALAPHVAETLAAALDLQPEIINPWHGIAYPLELESAVTEIGASVATAVGLARSRVPHKI
jgi:hypothetical protein